MANTTTSAASTLSTTIPSTTTTNENINSSTNATPSSNSTSSTTPQPFHTSSLYVGDIHPDVTEALLFEIFNAVGPVASIRVCRDAVTRRSLGYAYINFHNIADAERALDTMNYTSIKGVPCRIMWSQRDPALRKSGVGNIFIKNLDSSIDNKALYDTFSLFGNILSCKVIHNQSTGNKGYGYVHYETAEAATEAIDKINGMLIAGQEVYVGVFQKRQERGDEQTFTNCYVKNIPKHWNEDMLRKEFQSFGTISSCVIMKEPKKKNNEEENEVTTDVEESSRGFGFVNYEDPDAAAAAVDALNGKIYKSLDGETDIELYAGRAQKKSDRERELRQKFDALKTERISKYQGVNLYIKNLDDQMTDDELREVFSAYGSITSARIMKDQQGQSRGFGFVCFSTPEEATKAATEMNGKLVNGKPVYVALAQRKEIRRAQLEAQHAQRAAGMHPIVGGRGLPIGQPPMYGAAPMFYAQPNQLPVHQAAAARQAAAAAAAAGGFVYPQQMMGAPRMGGPRGGIPIQFGAGGRGGQQIPYGQGPGGLMPPFGMPMQQRPRGNGGRRGGPRMGGRGDRNGHSSVHPPPGPVVAQQQDQQNRNFKYTANARNQPGGMSNNSNDSMAANNVSTQLPNVPNALTPAALANASPETQKNMIGERLYPMIHAEQPELAGKITGMLLEMDNGELLHLLESPESLTSKIDEAIQVLNQHQDNSE